MNDFLVCEDIEKVYSGAGKKTAALEKINLKFDKGDFSAVTGPSGAGKSTLLHIMGAIDNPTSGRVLYRGSSIHALGERRLAHFRSRCVGFIFQFYHLLAEFTVLENVMLPSIAAGLAGAEMRKRAMGLLESVGLAGHSDKHCSELSGGEMQRTAICRALINDPDILLADEPTGNLDSGNSEHIIAILKRLNSEGKTLIIATHDRKLAGIAGNIAIIVDGRLEGFERTREAGECLKKGEYTWD